MQLAPNWTVGFVLGLAVGLLKEMVPDDLRVQELSLLATQIAAGLVVPSRTWPPRPSARDCAHLLRGSPAVAVGLQMRTTCMNRAQATAWLQARLPTTLNRDIDTLLPDAWQPSV